MLQMQQTRAKEAMLREGGQLSICLQGVQGPPPRCAVPGRGSGHGKMQEPEENQTEVIIRNQAKGECSQSTVDSPTGSHGRELRRPYYRYKMKHRRTQQNGSLKAVGSKPRAFPHIYKNFAWSQCCMEISQRTPLVGIDDK